MAGQNKYIEDDYVAKLLAEDARKSSIRYASDGLSALLPRRPPGSAPKPNTRFLRNLVREADSHNNALKRKEELEARMRLREIRRKEQDEGSVYQHDSDRKRRRLNSSSEHYRQSHREGRPRQKNSSPSHKRRNKDHASDSRKRREVDGECDSSNELCDTREPEVRRFETGTAFTRSKRRDHADRARDEDEHGGEYHDNSRRKSLSDENNDQDLSRRRQRHLSSRSNSSHDKRELSTKRTDSRCKAKHGIDKSQGHPSHQSHQSLRRTSVPVLGDGGSRSDSESDPLEDLVGPLPLSKGTKDTHFQFRGRGAFKHNDASSKLHSASNIDNHFSPSYNPRQDYAFSDSDTSATIPISKQRGHESLNDDDDWDMALEALRDRQKWQQKQSERMRAAGWNEEELQKWERNGLNANIRQHGHGTRHETEGDLNKVKWIKKGEGREWDRGKPID